MLRCRCLLVILIVLAVCVGFAEVVKHSQAQPSADITYTWPQTIIIGDPASLPSDRLKEWYETSKNVEGFHTTIENEDRYVHIAAGRKPTAGYEFGIPYLTVTATSINVSITMNAPEEGSVTKREITYPHILFCIINDQRTVIYDGYDLYTYVPVSSSPVTTLTDAFAKMVGRADATSILVILSGQSQPRLGYLYGSSRSQIDNLHLQEGQNIRITYHTIKYNQLIITNIERID